LISTAVQRNVSIGFLLFLGVGGMTKQFGSGVVEAEDVVVVNCVVVVVVASQISNCVTYLAMALSWLLSLL